MAELRRFYIDDQSVYAIWHITESTDKLRSAINLNESEEILYRSFVAESRKKQWLAYRLLIRELLKPDEFTVEYDQSGKPFLAGSEYHISVTHTEDLAAVIISGNARVGIDIEKIKPRIIKVKDKFLNDSESCAISEQREIEQLTIAWCAKEALYKIYGVRNLDFRENIFVQIPEQAGIEFEAWIILGGQKEEYRLFCEKSNGYILVYALDPMI
jgi:phosphopantetheinyl transferase